MALSTGTRLGPYEILSPVGAGGMGEVYRAKDTRLDRIVAVKVLPAQLSQDAGRRQRFEREARAISSLSHAHICALYDVGHQDGVDYLVMEYLEGETLANRLTKGALLVDQTLRYGVEIADALDKAHRQGIVHRDLKPGNIMLTKSGAKLMDFGLAKPAATAGAILSSTQMTREQPLTAEGTIVGTFQYMSPEQIEGREADARSDIFALGAVLYEMATGRRAFEGKSQVSVASAILEKDPEPISAVKPMTPQALDHAIRICLAKDPENRWQTGRDLGHALKWIADSGVHGGAQAPRAGLRNHRERLLWAGLALTSASTLVLLLYAYAGHAPARERVTQTYIKPMPETSFVLSDGSGFALSPDGRTLVYVASRSGGRSMLWTRPIDSLRAQELQGTEGASYPFWSPDSRFVGFFAGNKLKKIEAAGGPPLTLCDASRGRGGAWNGQGDIIFAPSLNSAIYRVASSGGPVAQVTTLDPSNQELSHRWPQFLPDGRHFIHLAGSVFTQRENPTNVVKLASLDSKTSEVLLRSHAGAVYASGQMLFLRLNTLMAQPFDTDRLKLSGEALPVADPVEEASQFSKGLFSASENGLLAYVEGTVAPHRRLVWYDRRGEQIGMVPDEDAYTNPKISPDGKRLLYYLDSPGLDVWTYDLDRGVKAPQTFGSTSARGSIFPVWSPDGRHIAYASIRDGKHALCMKSADGPSREETLLEESDHIPLPTDWSPDGKFLTYQEGSDAGWNVWMLPLLEERKPYLFMNSPFNTREASFSPDGKWVAYMSDESGEYRVYVVPFPGPGGKWQVSPKAGFTPHWRRDGKEIFYLSSDNRLTGVDVRANGSGFEVGAAHPLFETRSFGEFGRFDVTADGQRFVVPLEAGQPNTAVTLVVNWPAEIKR